MTKTQIIIEHIVVTFVESAGTYLIVIPTVNWSRAAIAGAIGAGLSAVYNVVRQSSPTITSPPVQLFHPITGESLNSVEPPVALTGV